MKRRHQIACAAGLGLLGACLGTDLSHEGRQASVAPPSGWEAVYSKLNKVRDVEFDPPASWRSDHPMRAGDPIESLFTVRVVLDPSHYVADEGCHAPACIESPTHVFPDPTDATGQRMLPVNLIPYSDVDDVVDAAGEEFARGDAVIAQYFAPGEIGYAIKHHRASHRTLIASDTDMKEDMKLQDTHIEIVVGVEDRDGAPGVITLNNPQTYPDYENPGRFDQETSYPMIFVKPVFPGYVASNAELTRRFRDNIRTMMVGFNAVSNFPNDYNGGDPLAAWNPDKVREHVAMMVRSIAGDTAARQWWQDPTHLIYCAELAHVSTSAGLIVPLNEDSVVPLIEASYKTGTAAARHTKAVRAWQTFVEEVALQNDPDAGEESRFVSLNQNLRAASVRVAIDETPASDANHLRPAYTYAPAADQEAEAKKLAFEPMTMSDIVEEFLKTTIPRQRLGEELAAPIQGQMLTGMREGLFEAMGMEVPDASEQLRDAPAFPQTAAPNVQVDWLYERIIEVVSTPWADYQEFQTKVAPLAAMARQITSPRGDGGQGLFTPPSLLHAVALGHHLGGLLRLEYIGHGLHTSLVRRSATSAQ